MNTLELGQVYMTCGVAARSENDLAFSFFINNSLRRHQLCDWGDCCSDDKNANDTALAEGERILSSYKYLNDKIWIITEWNRTVTTILFPDEY